MRVNLPNGDMVGHTGDIEATIVGCKAADDAVKVKPRASHDTYKTNFSQVTQLLKSYNLIDCKTLE